MSDVVATVPSPLSFSPVNTSCGALVPPHT
ncbi:hypothetical protein A2U01_0077428, partial [Trifolium medium]|nr:hypothetical protein [Trifolium medium]